jgi:hypothetical protein
MHARSRSLRRRGFSAGTLIRPASKRLLDDIRAGLVDGIVVYKIDRHSRPYPGEVVHKGSVYPGEHEPIVPWELWDGNAAWLS